ncbi:MAG: aminopeptidase P family protein [Bacillota bacterium]|nr:aminopeptidase P family protein [Bacillota bacterium]
MRSQLIALRNKMKENGIDVYIIPTTDYHGSEYVNDYFKCREYISGFTGSAGTLVVKQDYAGLWTDGRYFLQAQRQLVGSGITLMKMGEPDVPELEDYLLALPEQNVIGFDGRVVNCSMGEKLQERFRIVYDVDLVGQIWQGRPEIIPSKIYSLDLSVTGEETASKLERVRAEMKPADYLLISRLEDIAWLYNLRGDDIANTPVFYGFAIISRKMNTLYVMDEAFRTMGEDTSAMNRKFITDMSCCVKPYDELQKELLQLENCTLMMDEDSASYALCRSLKPSVTRIMTKSPVEKLKAVKNPCEIKATRQAHIRDGVAMVKFLYQLQRDIRNASDASGSIKSASGEDSAHQGNTTPQQITEISLAAQLEKCRRQQGAYDLSFPTIAGYEEHGAVIHYCATEESSSVLHDSGFVLIDSGGQYRDGTTDITRTIWLGSSGSDEEDRQRRKHYTAVLKSHIALATAVFDKGTTGAELDEIARKPLHELGLDFRHGTGHGVGHMLSVHEGPNVISPRGSESVILPGMITTDEPGFYLEGKYGIRIENELLCVDKGGRLAFEAVTMCPYDRNAVDASMLTAEEKEYINDYHRMVYETLEPLLEPDERLWLEQQCAGIQ